MDKSPDIIESHFGETFYDDEDEKQALKDVLREGMPFFYFYGIVIPAIAAVGIIQDIICFCAFQHRDLRSICTMILNALFASDIFHLICMVLLKSPTAWLTKLYSSPDDEGFYQAMEWVQKVYTGVYPFSQLAQCLVFVYTVAVVFEQYCVFFHPLKLYKWSTRDSTIKLIITLMNVTILIHLMHFFKFVRQPTLYAENPHNRICLSEIYRSDDYQTLDQYVYFVVFAIIPWIMVFFAELMIIYGKIRSKRDAINGDWPYPDGRLLRVFKSGRSTKTVLIVGGFFLLCGGIVCLTQGFTITTPMYTPLSANCNDFPVDAQFVKHDPRLELVYNVFLLLNSSCRLLLCAPANRDFRHVIQAFFARHKARLRRVMRRIKIFCACRPTGRGSSTETELPESRSRTPPGLEYTRAYIIFSEGNRNKSNTTYL